MDLGGSVADKQRHAAALVQEVAGRHLGPAEGVLGGAGETVGEAAGTMFAGSAVGGTTGRFMGSGVGRAAGKAVDATGSVATELAKSAAWAPFAALGFEMDDGPPRRYEN